MRRPACGSGRAAVGLRRLLVLWLVLLSCFAATVAMAGPARQVVEDKRYRFCHEKRYPLYPSERAWCKHVGDNNEDCPTLRDACEAKVKPDAKRDSFTPSAGGDSQKDKQPKLRKPDDAPDDRSAQRDSMKVSVPAGLSGVAQVMLIVLLAVGVGLIIRAILKNSVDGKDDSEPLADEDDKPAPERVAEARRIVETDVQRLLRLANEAAARAQYDDAIELAYAASLRRLEGDALIDMHESQTNGDYVRGLRRNHPELARALRDVVRDVERVQFGRNPADAPLFQSLLARVMGIVGRAGLILLLCVSLGTTSGCSAEPESEQEVPSEVVLGRGSYSPSGTRAVLGVLRDGGHTAAYRSEELAELGTDVDALVILPGGEPTKREDWDELFDWVRDGERRLILAGIAPPAELMDVRLIDSTVADDELFGAGELAHELGGLSTPVPPDGALVIGDSVFIEPLLVRNFPASEVYAAKRTFNDGDVVVLGDPQLFSNIAMVTADDARLMLTLVEDYQRVEVADPWTSAGSTSPLESLNNAKLTPLVIQLMILLALFMLWKGRAFGTLRDPIEHKRRSFADHVKALGLQYARAHAVDHAVGSYSQWALERFRARVPRSKQRNIDELADMIAARARKQPEQVREVLHQAQAAGDVAGPPSFRVSNVRGYSGYQPQPAPPPANTSMQLLRQLSELVAAATGANSRRPNNPRDND